MRRVNGTPARLDWAQARDERFKLFHERFGEWLARKLSDVEEKRRLLSAA